MTEAARTLTLIIEPGGHFVAVRAGATLLEAALQAGLLLPRSCRTTALAAPACAVWSTARSPIASNGRGSPPRKRPKGGFFRAWRARSDVTIDQPEAREAMPDTRRVRLRSY